MGQGDRNQNSILASLLLIFCIPSLLDCPGLSCTPTNLYQWEIFRKLERNGQYLGAYRLQSHSNAGGYHHLNIHTL